jgi:hypothetical protein
VNKIDYSNLWTEDQEATFQKLLQRRREVAAMVAETFNEDYIEHFAESMVEDYTPQDAWQDYIDSTSPQQLQDESEYGE